MAAGVVLGWLIGCSAPEQEGIYLAPIPVDGDGAEGGTDPRADVRAASMRALDPNKVLRVEVQRPDGGPLAGADVIVLHAAALDPAALLLSSRVTGDRIRTLEGRATWRGRTGADGLVQVPMAAKGGCLVAVRAGALYGEGEYRGSGGDRLDVVVTERRSVDVAVTAWDGSPAQGVALTVRAEDAKGVLQALPITSVTDANGVATLHVPAGRLGGLEVMARIAVQGALRVPIGGEGPASISLPRTGSLEIEVQGHPTFEGAPAGLVQVFAASDGSRSRTTLAVPIVNGRATVPLVEAGTALRIICAVADGTDPSEILASQSISVPAVAAGEVGRARVSFDQYQRVGRKLEARQ